MFRALRQRHPGIGLKRIIYWMMMHFLCYLWIAPLYRYRAWGVHHVPRTGPVLLVATHQSFLDPILVGLACHHRQFYAMARRSLWKDSKLLGKLMDTLNAIPVDQENADVASLRQCVQVLKDGQALLVFPEGARTEDGSILPFAQGIMLLVRRAKPKVVPVAIEGAFDVWPRGRKSPKWRGRIGVTFGQAIDPDDLISRDNPTEYLRQQCEVLRQQTVKRIASP